MAERALASGGATVAKSASARWAEQAGYWIKAPHAVLFMCAVVAVRIHEFFPGISVFKPVLTGSIGGMILLSQRTHKSIRQALPKSPLSKVVFLYFGFVLLSIPLSLYQGGAFLQARSLLPGILLFAAFLLSPPTRENLDRLQFGYVVLVLFFAAYSQFFGRSWGGRLISLSGSYDSNDVSSLLAIGLPLSIGVLMRTKGGRERTGAVLAVIALVLGVIATASRGGTLAMVGGLLVFVVGLRGSARVIAPVVMAMVGAVFWVTAPAQFRERMNSLTRLENDYNLTQSEGRKAVWARGRGYIKQYPILGVGAGNFYIADGANKQDKGLTGKWSTAHNAYLQAYVELGIPGGTVYVLMLLTGALFAFRLWAPRQPGRIRGPPEPLYRPEYLASLATYAVAAYFLSHAYFTPIFVILGMVALATRIVEHEARGIGTEASDGAVDLTPVRLPGQRGGLAWVGGTPEAAARGGVYRVAVGNTGTNEPRRLPRRG
jgi:O-antigen ligase